jgi:flagellar biosynthesis chaperone FliJ
MSNIEERIAQIRAHRAVTGSEHDVSRGRFHGDCIVCGVPFPCEYVGNPLVISTPGKQMSNTREVDDAVCGLRDAVNKAGSLMRRLAAPGYDQLSEMAVRAEKAEAEAEKLRRLLMEIETDADPAGSKRLLIELQDLREQLTASVASWKFRAEQAELRVRELEKGDTELAMLREEMGREVGFDEGIEAAAKCDPRKTNGPYSVLAARDFVRGYDQACDDYLAHICCCALKKSPEAVPVGDYAALGRIKGILEGMHVRSSDNAHRTQEDMKAWLKTQPEQMSDGDKAQALSLASYHFRKFDEIEAVIRGLNNSPEAVKKKFKPCDLNDGTSEPAVKENPMASEEEEYEKAKATTNQLQPVSTPFSFQASLSHERKLASDLIKRLKKERDETRWEAKAEMDGKRALREKYGAHDNETWPMFIERLKRERDEARHDLREMTDDRDSWMQQAEDRMKDAVDAIRALETSCDNCGKRIYKDEAHHRKATFATPEGTFCEKCTEPK